MPLVVVTTRIRIDRIASSTRNAHVSPDAIVGPDIVAEEGYVLAVRIVASVPRFIFDSLYRIVQRREQPQGRRAA